MKPECVICCEPVRVDEHGSPERAVICRTYGNYGSTVFDPMTDVYIKFLICDKCFKPKFHGHNILCAYTETKEVTSHVFGDEP